MGNVFEENFPQHELPEQPAAQAMGKAPDQKPAGAPDAGSDEPSQPAQAAVSKGIRNAGQDQAAPPPAKQQTRSDRATDPQPESRPAPAPAPAPAPRGTGQVRTVNSTAYCLTGTMASGRRVYNGAAAMNGVPLGATYRVLSGPAAGRVLTIEDRIGSGSQFDIAYPGNCGTARQYGRRTIRIERM